MLLKTLSVTNSQGSILSLPLEDISGGFVVQSIDGLGPVKATLVSSSFANMDGEQYHSSRREPRNLHIKLGLVPDYAINSVHYLRAQLYQFFMPKTEVKLVFGLFDKFSTSVINQRLDLEIYGRVESFEPDIFTNEPALNLTIMCYDPDLVDPKPVTFSGNTVEDLTETTLTYKGSVETGVVFTLLPRRIVPEFTIFHRTPNETLRSTHFTQELTFEDELKIKSVVGSKSALLKRAGVETSVLYSITPQSTWIELFPGDNHLRVQAEGLPVPYTVEYTNKYGGL